MNRRRFVNGLTLTAAALSCGSLAVPRKAAQAAQQTTPQEFPPLDISRAEWKEILPEDRYRILFRAGTERAFSSPLDKKYDPGTYVCAACFLPLFDSKDKFDSGTGWPSFTRPIDGRVDTELDFKLIFPRTEYHCARCGGHQGHVFEDGPPPTGQRWCNNGLALEFVPQGKELPPLRTSS